MTVLSRSIAALILSLIAFSVFAKDLPNFIKPEHYPSLQNYLSRHYYLLAPEQICNCDAELSKLREELPSFQPYYAVGDINDDSIEDFAVGLVSNTAEPKLTVVVFHGPFSNKRIVQGVELFKDAIIDRPQQIISIFKSRIEYGERLPARLDFGPSPFGSDDIWIFTYDWKKKKYIDKYFWSDE